MICGDIKELLAERADCRLYHIIQGTTVPSILNHPAQKHVMELTIHCQPITETTALFEEQRIVNAKRHNGATQTLDPDVQHKYTSSKHLASRPQTLQQTSQSKFDLRQLRTSKTTNIPTTPSKAFVSTETMLFTTILSLATLASAAPYAFPNSTSTTAYAASSGFVGTAGTGAASLTPTVYPNTMPLNTTAAPAATMMLRPRSTDSICSHPGHLVCSMDGKQVGYCGFTGGESLQWTDVGDGEACWCWGGECAIVVV